MPSLSRLRNFGKRLDTPPRSMRRDSREDVQKYPCATPTHARASDRARMYTTYARNYSPVHATSRREISKVSLVGEKNRRRRSSSPIAPRLPRYPDLSVGGNGGRCDERKKLSRLRGRNTNSQVSSWFIISHYSSLSRAERRGFNER